MINLTEPIFLQSEYCSLVPLSFEYCDDLIQAVNDGELWKLWYTYVPEPKHMFENIKLRLNMQTAGTMVPFAVINNQTKKAVGMTTYLNIEPEQRRLEIGGTWYRKSAQGTQLNLDFRQPCVTNDSTIS